MPTEQELINAVMEKTQKKEGRQYLSCEQAFELAREYNVRPTQIGNICNKKKIKLFKCQLGCF